MTGRNTMLIAFAAAFAAVFAAVAADAPASGTSRLGLHRAQNMSRSGALSRTPSLPSATAAGKAGAPGRNAAKKPSANAVATASAAESDAGSSDLNFKEAPSDMVFEVYGKLVERTVLKDPQTPAVSITLQSLPGQKLSKEEQIRAIETVMEMNGIHFEPFGEKFVRALPRKDVRKTGIPLVSNPDGEPLPELENVVSMMIDFKNIPVDEAQKALEGFKSNSGLLQVFERTNKILVTDSQMNINRMVEIARAIDISSPVLENVFVRQIKHAAASEIKTALEQIVTESQKEQEKNGKTQQNPASQIGSMRFGSMSAGGTSLLRRPGMGGAASKEPAAPQNVASLVTSVSDADRGMIRGKVLIIADERSNKLIIVTMKSNMDFFDKVIEQLDVETTPDVQVKVYRLKYAEAEDVSAMINDLIGNSASSKSTSKQATGATTGTNSNLTRGTTGSSPASRAAAANQRSQGASKAGELSKENVTVLADKRINGLVVMARTEDFPAIEQIIESMDVKLSQVLIETAIIEVTLGDDLSTGIDWVLRGKKDGKRDGFANRGSSGLGGGGGAGVTALQNMFTNAVSATTASSAFGAANPIGSGINYLLKSDKLNLAAVIKASQSDNRAKYLASPIIMTVDNKEATIDATEARKFFAGYESSTSYSTYVRTPKYDSKDIGIKIKVTPKINPNGTVMLKVEEEYSQLGAGQTILVDGGGGKQDEATIDTSLMRKMTADILLDNMQTVVLGGLTEKYKSDRETGIPVLKDIPWVGKWLFGSVTQMETRKELLVFMTPYVLDDAKSAQMEAARRKKAMSDQSPWDDNGWSSSKLADPVAKKEQMRRLKDEAKKQDEERAARKEIEKWKLERAKTLEKMDEKDRKEWEKLHSEEIRQQNAEYEKEQAQLKALVKEIRDGENQPKPAEARE